MGLLENKQTASAFNVAKFYDKQKRYRAAVIYYNEVIREQPGSVESEKAKKRIDQLRAKLGDAVRITVALAAWLTLQPALPVVEQLRPAPEMVPLPTTCPMSGYVVLLPTNPGALLTVIGDLPSCAASAAAASLVASLVCSPRTISTNDMTGTGLKKCRPTKRSGWDIEDASFVMETEEVLLARIVSALTNGSTCLKIFVLRP